MTNHWFHSKTPASKKSYVSTHPNSIYAGASSKTAKKKTPEQIAATKQLIMKKEAAIKKWEKQLAGEIHSANTRKTLQVRIQSYKEAVATLKASLH